MTQGTTVVHLSVNFIFPSNGDVKLFHLTVKCFKWKTFLWVVNYLRCSANRGKSLVPESFEEIKASSHFQLIAHPQPTARRNLYWANEIPFSPSVGFQRHPEHRWAWQSCTLMPMLVLMRSASRDSCQLMSLITMSRIGDGWPVTCASKLPPPPPRMPHDDSDDVGRRCINSIPWR